MIAHPANTHLVRAHLLRSVALILALGAAGGTARAADPAEGHRIAERWCSSCHVAGDRSGGTDAVPTLESIANDRRRSPEWVRQWLNDPHPPMPNLPLTRAQIEDVVVYLGSLSR
jgi:mono/diheme cytochrome c family protein